MIQSKRIRGSAGEPLPTVFQTLEDHDTRFLRGQLSLTCAGAGTGKSALILTQAVKSHVPSLYISADSDSFTQLTRSICIATGCRMEDAAKAVLSGDLGAATKALSGLPIRFIYDASPNLDTVESTMEAYEEVYGEYPAFTVVDNVTNVHVGGSDEDPFSGLEGLMDYLHTMARETSSHVAGLHHVTGPFNDANKPIPLSGVKGQVSRVPEMILTLFKPTPETIGVSQVKARGAKADPSGNTYAELEFEGDSMRISDMRSYQSTKLVEPDLIMPPSTGVVPWA